MTWNYRIVTYAIPDAGYELREVYYDDQGRECGSCPPFLSGETPEDVVAALELALKDARERPVFVAPASWADPKDKKGQNPR